MVAFAELVPRLRCVNQHEVDIADIEARERFLDALLCRFIRLEISMELRRDIELLARHARAADALADFFLISIRPCRVDMAVSCRDGVHDSLRGGRTVDEPCAEPDFRNARAVGQGKCFVQNHDVSLLFFRVFLLLMVHRLGKRCQCLS